MNHQLRAGLRARRVLVDRLTRVRHAGASRRLEASHPGQRAAWDRLSRRTAAVHAELAACGPQPGVTPLWAAYLDGLERALLPAPDWEFLRDPLLLETMVVRGARLRHRQLRWLRGRLSADDLRAGLREDPAGAPALSVPAPVTSATALHHLFHLERLRNATGVRAGDLDLVVEWGGGYGGFARTLRRTARGRPPAHVIVDLPLVGALQWTYLSTVFGEEHVDLALTEGHRPRAGALTIVPSVLGPTLDVRADLFVSLWGLSETARATQDAMAAGAFHDARHLLLAFQHDGPDTPDAEHTGRLAQSAGATIEPTGILAHSSYALR